MGQPIIIFIILYFFIPLSTFSQSSMYPVKSIQWTVENDDKLMKDSLLSDRLSSDLISYKGGIILKYDKTKFGGLSSLSVLDNGKGIIAVSDYSSIGWEFLFKNNNRSRWYQLDVNYKESILESAVIKDQGQVHDIDGKLIKGGIESMALGSDLIYISFDGKGEIFTYKKNNRFTTAKNTIKISDFPNRRNAGIEALTLTSYDQLFAVYEKNPRKEYCEAWLICPETNSTKHLKYYNSLEEIKGATTLQNGDIIILEKTWDRHEKTNHIKLQLISNKELESSEVKTKNILDVKSKALDNFEGITSYVRYGKEYLLLISDDNGDSKADQQTILLNFELTLHDKK